MLFRNHQVAPAELEALLVSHNAVQDAAVVSKLDERRGELLTAFVVLQPQQSATEEELQHYVAGIIGPLAQFKIITITRKSNSTQDVEYCMPPTFQHMLFLRDIEL